MGQSNNKQKKKENVSDEKLPTSNPTPEPRRLESVVSLDESDFDVEYGHPPSISSLGYTMMHRIPGKGWFGNSGKMYEDIYSQVKVGSGVTYALSHDRLTITNLTLNNVSHTFDKKVWKMDCGGGFGVCIMEDGTVYSDFVLSSCLGGSSSFKEVSFGSISGLDVDPRGRVVAVASGYYYTYLLLLSGELIHIGQNNQDNFHKGNATHMPALIDCPVRLKCIAAGSNHTVGITFDGELYGISGGHSNIFTEMGPITIPEKFGVKKWFNVACGGFNMSASADNGVYFWNGSTLAQKVSDLQPHQIKCLYSIYSELTIVTFPQYYKKQQIERIVADDAIFSTQAGCVGWLKWTKENHKHFPSTFRKKALMFMMVTSHLNKTYFSKQKIPKVLCVLIIEKYSNSYWENSLLN